MAPGTDPEPAFNITLLQCVRTGGLGQLLGHGDKKQSLDDGKWAGREQSTLNTRQRVRDNKLDTPDRARQNTGKQPPTFDHF